MTLSRSQTATYLLLAAILVMGGFIRGISLISNGPGTLLDLDAFHSLRAVESIMNNGYIPRFDGLSSAPNGTSYAFATSQGYYSFIGSIGLLSGLSPNEALAISPSIFFALELVSLFALTLAISKSTVAALLASFFATSLRGWSAISILGADPVAENLGAFLFLSAMILAVLLTQRPSYLLVGLLGFVDGISIEAHPVTYYFVNLVLVATASTYVVRREWKHAWHTILAVLASLYSIALIEAGGTGLAEARLFSQSAFWLASLKNNIFTINNSILISEIGLVTILLSGVSILVILHHKLATLYMLVAWAVVLYCVVLIGELAVYTPYGTVVEGIPFSAPLTLSHRVMPYLPPVLCILAAIAVGKFLLPSVAGLSRTLKINQRTLSVVLLMVILAASAFQLSNAFQYSVYYASSFNTEPTYSSLYTWIREHTAINSTFAANDLGFGAYVKAIDQRSVFFTTSQEDLTVPDLTQRAILQTCLFLPLCGSNGTEQMIRSYQIQYAIIITPALIVNQNSSSLVSFDYYPIGGQYLRWFQSRPGFVEVYSDSNSAVFAL